MCGGGRARETSRSVSELLEGGLGISGDVSLLSSLLHELVVSNLALVEGGALDLALLLEGGDNLAVLPAVAGGEVTEVGGLAAGAKAEDLEGLRDNHALHAVVGVGDALEGLEAVEGGLATGSLVGEHATDHALELGSRGADGEGATLRVGVGLLGEFVLELDAVAPDVTGDLELLAADSNHALAAEELLGDDARKATDQVPAAVHDDDALKHCAHLQMMIDRSSSD
mmetsp:Transcript_17575/g.34572  ORF Transcript_17575/g.34572 Transcript_17575/m.34572 type:complete len:227 (-) Transcript_17575:29-709(-)